MLKLVHSAHVLILILLIPCSKGHHFQIWSSPLLRPYRRLCQNIIAIAGTWPIRSKWTIYFEALTPFRVEQGPLQWSNCYIVQQKGSNQKWARSVNLFGCNPRFTEASAHHNVITHGPKDNHAQIRSTLFFRPHTKFHPDSLNLAYSSQLNQHTGTLTLGKCVSLRVQILVVQVNVCAKNELYRLTVFAIIHRATYG